MTSKLAAILTEVIEEKYKAQAIYRLVLQQLDDIASFTNIVETEGRHIEAWLTLFRKYGIPVPVDKWPIKATVPSSILEACGTVLAPK